MSYYSRDVGLAFADLLLKAYNNRLSKYIHKDWATLAQLDRVVNFKSLILFVFIYIDLSKFNPFPPHVSFDLTILKLF